MNVAASIDFIIFSHQAAITFLPNNICYEGQTIFLGSPCDDCDVDSDDEYISSCTRQQHYSRGSRHQQVSCGLGDQVGLVSCTVQCFGYRLSDRCRCKNSRWRTYAPHI